MNEAITRQPGTITPYTDILGRPQLSVTGPKGHVLITRDKQWDPYRVWFSDSLDAIATEKSRAAALERACRAAGIGL